MRRITLWALSTITVVVLLFSYRTSTSSRTSSSAVASGTLGGGTVAANGSTTPLDPGSTPATTPSTSGGSSTTGSSGVASYTGTAVDTRFGPVQVQITVVSGKVTKSVVTQVPWNSPRDQEINTYAVPILNQEVVQAQSANIDMVSGATYTSDGYLQSLQSALDQAHI